MSVAGRHASIDALCQAELKSTQQRSTMHHVSLQDEILQLMRQSIVKESQRQPSKRKRKRMEEEATRSRFEEVRSMYLLNQAIRSAPKEQDPELQIIGFLCCTRWCHSNQSV
jgi:hypothetical protein